MEGKVRIENLAIEICPKHNACT